MQQPGKKEIFILGAILGLILAAAGTFWFKAQTGLQPLPPTFPLVTAAMSEITSASRAVSISGGNSSSGSSNTSAPMASTPYIDPGGDKKLVIYIVGAVRRTGVYELPIGSRLTDAVQAAGGFSDDADREAVNLALPLTDGSRYSLPRLGEAVSQVLEILATPSAVSKINLNTADQTMLETLPNIGPTRAKAILEYRSRKGPFRSIDELKQVSGIGESIFAQLRELVVCE